MCKICLYTVCRQDAKCVRCDKVARFRRQDCFPSQDGWCVQDPVAEHKLVPEFPYEMESFLPEIWKEAPIGPWMTGLAISSTRGSKTSKTPASALDFAFDPWMVFTWCTWWLRVSSIFLIIMILVVWYEMRHVTQWAQVMSSGMSTTILVFQVLSTFIGSAGFSRLAATSTAQCSTTFLWHRFAMSWLQWMFEKPMLFRTVLSHGTCKAQWDKVI